ncbi:MAG TPA: carotenoid oxygenase family protein [Thermoanaerobaculia bacterium]
MSEPARASGGADFAPHLERAFDFLPEERSEAVAVAGELPAWLRGTLYVNGPGRFERGGLRYRHWLDGDGLIEALRCDEDGARFTCRFVRSVKWTAEEEAGRALFRAFGTAFPGDRLLRGIALESPVNVSVLPYAGTLLACGEQGLPWEIDPETLATRGPYTFGGGLGPIAPFSAHPKLDPASGELWNFGVSFASAQPALNVYRCTAGGKLAARKRLPLPYPCSLHDFALAPRHAVFYLSPYLLDMAALAGGAPLLAALDWRPELGSRLLIVARDTLEAVAELPLGGRYCLHTANAFEDAQGRLVVDLLELERPVYDQYAPVPDLFRDVAAGWPVRLVVDLEAGALVERRELPYGNAPDFPSIDLRLAERPCDDLWLLGIAATGRPGRKFFDQLVRLSWADPETQDVWQPPPGRYLASEPVVVLAPENLHDGSLRGVAVCHLFDAERRASSWLVFDAFDLAAGPRAVLPLAAPVTPGFHAMFAPLRT